MTKAREAAVKWLKDNDWDYLKYGDRRGDRSSYDTLMNYEISQYLADAFEAGFKAGREYGRREAIEEAAKVARDKVANKSVEVNVVGYEIADAIRSLLAPKEGE